MSHTNTNMLCEQYMISSKGFLPNECCCEFSKENSHFNYIIDIANTVLTNHKNFENNKNTDNVVKFIDSYRIKYDPVKFSVETLSVPETQMTYSLLCMIMNRYVWSEGVMNAKTHSNIPAIIAAPLYDVSNKLGIATSLTHAAVDLWNWHIIDPMKPFSVDNIQVNYSMTGDISECWFYCIMIAIEGIGGKNIKLIPDLALAIEKKSINDVIQILGKISDDIINSTKLIKRMYEKCDSDFFFNKLRIYLSGSINENLPVDGLTLNVPRINDPNHKIKILFKGGSAAQSSLIQTYDRILEVDHNNPPKNNNITFLQDMHTYMPHCHKKFLEFTENKINSRKFVLDSRNDELIESYDNCIKQLSKFRCAHLGLVQHYILNHITASNDNNAHTTKGTGGTDPEKFCKDLINGTLACSSNSKPHHTGSKKYRTYYELLCNKLLWIYTCTLFVSILTYSWWNN